MIQKSTDQNSAIRKIFVEGPNGIKVPFKEISLTNNDAPVRIYDTTGPENTDVMKGLPELRKSWILNRGEYVEKKASYVSNPKTSDPELPMPHADRKILEGKGNVTQLYYARKGIITEEMKFVAIREKGSANPK